MLPLLFVLLQPAQPSPLGDVVVAGQVRAVRDLLDHGADVNERDEQGVTPLMRAASAGRGDMVRILLEHHADVNAKTSGGVTALMMATVGGYIDAVRPLLAAKADVNLQDNEGRTALMGASTSGDGSIVDAVLNAGASIDAQDRAGGTALTYAAAEGHAAAIAALQKHGAKPRPMELTLAAAGCNTDVVRAFVASGMPVNVESTTTPLHAAAARNCLETAAFLIEKGADVNATDHDGWTPMIRASSAGHTEMVRLLLDKGADMNIADTTGRTAWTYAAMGNHREIAELFREIRNRPHGDPTHLDVTSPTLTSGEPMPRDYTADGRNVSPPLNWSGAPDGTKSFAAVCEDPDAGNPPPFVHWVIYNIPSTATGLPENIPFEPGAAMPASIAGAVQGLSGFRRPIYRGPAPPPGKPHHYHFVVYALDASDLPPALTRADLLDAIKGHVLATGELVATYERKP